MSGFEVGHVSHRQDGDYKKVGENKWVKVIEPKQDQQEGSNIQTMSIIESSKDMESVINDNNQYDSYGLRVIDSYEEDPSIGEELKPSSIWEEGEPTDEKLSGTSTIGIKHYNEEGIENSLNRLFHNNYFGDIIVLVGGGYSEYGQDPGEEIIPKANVLSKYKIIEDENGNKSLLKIENRKREKSIMENEISKRIKFNFHPYEFEKNNHTIEKADNEGRKRRYLRGISSGLKVDAHGERMTEKCIKSFMNQAETGEILLFPDMHGIKESEDIGKLSHAEILPNTGDWYTEYRLYDQHDDIGANKLEKVDTIWKQINGLPPYKQKRQKGFSIEGVLPDSAIIMNSFGEMDRSVLDDVLLDGVILVPRPAYKDSVVNAVFKALGEVNPYRRDSIVNTLRENVASQEVEENYYSMKWKYFDSLEQLIEKIMIRSNNDKRQELEILFEEFKELMINLVLNSESMFVPSQDKIQIEIDGLDEKIIPDQIKADSIMEKGNPKLELFKSLYSELSNLLNHLEG